MKKLSTALGALPKALFLTFAVVGLITRSEYAADGIREGLSLLGGTVIPSLFPFLVLSSYLTQASGADKFCKLFKKPSELFFKTSAVSSFAVIMGAVGGYPLGAKTTAELFRQKKISDEEAGRLLLWCTCPGPAFAVTALGSAILKNTAAGITVYASALLSSLTLGFLCRFLAPKEFSDSGESVFKGCGSLSDAVNSALNAILGISAWVLTFSCISGITDTIPLDNGTKLFLKAVLEVTSGCKACAQKVSLPVIAAAVGFGGVAVIFQISPYLKECKVPLKRFAAARILNAAFCAFYCSVLIKLFPTALSASVTYQTKLAEISLSYTAPICAILIIMCALFVFQVDNRKKLC